MPDLEEEKDEGGDEHEGGGEELVGEGVEKGHDGVDVVTHQVDDAPHLRPLPRAATSAPTPSLSLHFPHSFPLSKTTCIFVHVTFCARSRVSNAPGATPSRLSDPRMDMQNKWVRLKKSQKSGRIGYDMIGQDGKERCAMTDDKKRLMITLQLHYGVPSAWA